MLMNKPLYLYLFILLLSATAFASEVGYIVDSDNIDGTDNRFLSSNQDKIDMLIPTLLVLVTIIFFAIDFGSIGVITGCILGLIVSNTIGLISISIFSITSLIIMAGILIFKLSR